jgi:thioesterase domain-containing protein
MHPASAKFREDTNFLQRRWYEIEKRVALEKENVSYRGLSHLRERARRAIDVSVARGEIALSKLRNEDANPKNPSVAYILERLGMEHDKAFEQYKPKPYGGSVVIYRASNQLKGLVADDYLGWRKIFSGDVKVLEIPGHQQNMLVEPNVSILAQKISSRIDEVSGRSGNRVSNEIDLADENVSELRSKDLLVNSEKQSSAAQWP